MFIVYGTGSRRLEGEPVHELPCDNCQHPTHKVSAIVRHAHVFWCPLFPIGRLLFTTCEQCGHQREAAELPEPVAKQLRKAVFTPRRLALSFAGPLLFLLGFVYDAGSDALAQQREEQVEQVPVPPDFDDDVP